MKNNFWAICSSVSVIDTYFSNEWEHLSCVPAATVVLTGLEPNTTYEVRVAAVNGKGQGEFSHTETFQTLPIRKSVPNIPSSTTFMTHTSK